VDSLAALAPIVEEEMDAATALMLALSPSAGPEPVP
jgi:hypothetical protein